MKKFASVDGDSAIERRDEHGGRGPIQFQRILNSLEFRSPVDFIDYTHVPSGSSIGRHEHHGNEEIYFVTAGTPLMRVNGEEARLRRGSFAVVRDGEWHELVNDTAWNVEIMVIQVGLKERLGLDAK